jgi:hypothetical protein
MRKLLGGLAFVTMAAQAGPDARVFRAPLPRGKPVKSVETECRLQKS